MKRKSGKLLMLLFFCLFLLIGVSYLIDGTIHMPFFQKERQQHLVKKEHEKKEQKESKSVNDKEREKESAAEEDEEMIGSFTCHSKGRYYYELLDEDDQFIYDQIAEGIYTASEEITIKHVEDDKFKQILAMVENDHPEFFWFEGRLSYTVFFNKIVIVPDYNVDAEMLSVKQAEVLSATEDALSEIGQYDSDFGQIKALLDYVVEHSAYEEDAEDDQNLYSCLVNHASVCAGYAKTMQYLLQTLGYDALYLSGNIKDGGNHAWNMVKVGDHYYHIDATFADPQYLNDEELVTDQTLTDYSYLFFDDAMCFRNRELTMELSVPMCDDDSLNYYRFNNLLFTSAGEDFEAAMHENVYAGNRLFTCRFADQDSYEEAVSRISDGLYVQMAARYLGGAATSGMVFNEKNYTIILFY